MEEKRVGLKKDMTSKETRNEKLRRPHFSWPIFGRGLFILLIDSLSLLMLVGVLCGVCVILGRVSLFKGADWVGIIRYIVWPFCIFALLLLFRNPLLQILYEVPGFIRRSWYGNGSSITNPDKNDQNIGHNSEGTEDNANALESKMQRLKLLEGKVLAQIGREYGVEIAYNKGIEGSRYFFDGVMELGRSIVGIEVKCIARPSMWQVIFERMTSIYSGFSADIKERFIFMICICGKRKDDEKKRIEQIASEKPFRTIVRFFPENID